MTIFDQRYQKVTYQYNYANADLDKVETAPALLEELKKLRTELQQAIERQAVTGEPAVDAKYNLDKAVIEAEKPTLDKKKLADYLDTAKTAITGIAAVGGLVAALTKAVELIGTLF
jgi:hypothetical protein